MRDREERFITLAESRVKKTLKLLNQLGRLTDKSNYKYTREQGEHIINTLQERLDVLKVQFESGNPDCINFKLEDDKGE